LFTLQQIIGAPSYFSKIWACIKGWIHHVTASKLVFLSPQVVLPTLEQFIDSENIPQAFGGASILEAEKPLSLDSALENLFTWWVSSRPGLPPGLLRWVKKSDGRHVAAAPGTTEYNDCRWKEVAELKIND